MESLCILVSCRLVYGSFSVLLVSVGRQDPKGCKVYRYCCYRFLIPKSFYCCFSVGAAIIDFFVCISVTSR